MHQCAYLFQLIDYNKYYYCNTKNFFMRKKVIVLLCSIACLITSKYSFCQTTNVISGTIKNSQTKENLSAVSVMLKGSSAGTFTDEKGNFRLVTTEKPPFVIVITSIG